MKTTVNVNFTKNNTNKKDEVVLEFQVRGDLTDEQIVKLARLKIAGSIVIDIRSSQADLDDGTGDVSAVWWCVRPFG